MDNSDRNTEFPLINMPRMGRRNAVTYPSRILSDDDGAFSPINLLHRASASDIDPQGIIEKELQMERRNNERRSRGTFGTAPIASVLDGWKKLHDAKNNVRNGIERLFEPARSLKASTSAIEAKPKISKNKRVIEKEESVLANHRGNPVIPWHKQEVRQTTIAEERRKLFESFDMTSIEPPETPQVSELTLRKMAKKNKRRKKENLNSQESVSSSFHGKLTGKAPYSNVQPKVDTRWDKMEEQQQQNKSQTVSNSVDKEDKFKKMMMVSEKPSMSNRGGKAGSSSARPLQPFPVRKHMSNTEHKSKLVTNYPASESVKNTTDRLPLTIAPRYNHKKALGLTNDSRRIKRTEEGLNGASASKLYGSLPANQRAKYDSLRAPKAPVGNSLKSTFFNLQRINNGGASPSGNVNKKPSPTTQVIVGRYSANILGTPVIGAVKKTVPVITTIQPPPSPFLASKISIQSQMNEIPINGEKIAAITSKGTTKTNVRNEPKPGRMQLQKPPIGKTKNNPVSEPEAAKPIQLPKVVPTLGAAPNKYNNIYIGPYSGSESDGEHQSLKRRR